MLTKIQKWGNSLALRIPKTFASDAKLEDNSVVEIMLVEGQIIVKPIAKPQWTLEKLLSDINSDNIHGEADPGNAIGKEIW